MGRIEGFKIDINVMQKWNDVMKNGILIDVELADAGRLIYDRTYFAEGGRAFKFQRKKTAARSNGMAIVIVPIIEPLRNILDEIAARPTRGGVVFPQIFNGATEEAEMRKLCVQEYSNIKDRVIRICKEVLEWDK